MIVSRSGAVVWVSPLFEFKVELRSLIVRKNASNAIFNMPHVLFECRVKLTACVMRHSFGVSVAKISNVG